MNIQIKCLKNFKKIIDPKNIFGIKNNIFYNDNQIFNDFQICKYIISLLYII